MYYFYIQKFEFFISFFLNFYKTQVIIRVNYLILVIGFQKSGYCNLREFYFRFQRNLSFLVLYM
jgi:hypothetical protein